MYKEQEIKEIVNAIVQISCPEKVYLFGSYARGDFTDKSDIDILVVEKGQVNTRQESIKIRKFIRKFKKPVDVIIATEQQMEKYKDNENLIYKQVLDQGKIYYAK